MNDTSDLIKEKLEANYASRSGEEKLLMALSMFETARELVIASLPKDISESELRKELFLRFYGNDFDDEEKARIIKRLLQYSK